MPIADSNGVKIAYVIVTRHDGVMRITMNRPTRKNALTAANMLTGNAVEEVEVRTKWGVRCRAGGYSDCRSRNNYLLGNAPPAFDILFWNSDTTSLPAQLHS